MIINKRISVLFSLLLSFIMSMSSIILPVSASTNNNAYPQMIRTSDNSYLVENIGAVFEESQGLITYAQSKNDTVDGHQKLNASEINNSDALIVPESLPLVTESDSTKSVIEEVYGVPVQPEVPTTPILQNAIFAPANINSTSTCNNITIIWDRVEETDSYDVEADGIIIDCGNSASYVHTPLEPNSIHSYRVRAKNGSYIGEWSAYVTKYTLLSAPDNLNISLSDNTAIITWNAVSGATGYEIYRNDAAIGTVSEASYTDTDIPTGSLPYYNIKAYNEIGNLSPMSNNLTAAAVANRSLMVSALPPTTINSNITLTQDTEYGDLYITGGTVNLAGYKLTVNGTLIQSAGTLQINGGALIVTGNYMITSSSGSSYSMGYLKMTNASDYVSVAGDFVMNSVSHSSYLTAGLLEVKGDFTQKAAISSKSFKATGTHRVLLSGADLQKISFEKYNDSNFNELEIADTAYGVSFSTPISISTMKSMKNKILSSLSLYSTNSKLVGDIVINGDLNLIGQANLDLSGKRLAVTGSLVQSSGTLFIDGGELNVAGDYKLQGASGGYSTGYLKMTNILDKVYVGGNFITESITHTGYLTAGVMEIKGDFTQKATMSSGSFNATGIHKVLLSGERIQQVSFDKYNASNFNELEIADAAYGVSFSTPVSINVLKSIGNKIMSSLSLYSTNSKLAGDMVINGDLNLMGSANLDLSGKRLTVTGSLIQSSGILFIDSGELNIAGDYRLQSPSGGYSTGYLKMTNMSDKVYVGGNFITDSYPHTGYLTAGLMEIKGDFTQKATMSSSSFNATGTHKVVLSGTSLQKISFDKYNASNFNELEISDTAYGVSFSTPVSINTIKATNNKIVSPLSLYSGNSKLAEDITINGDLNLIGPVNLDLSGKRLTVTGSLVQSSGIVFIDGGELVITGDYKLQGASGSSSTGYLKMTNAADYVLVASSFIMDSTYSHSSYLTAGLLEIRGDFAQKATTGFNNFNPTGVHKVLLSGTGLQRISFNNPYYSKFNILITTKPLDTGYSFNTQPVWITLMEMGDDTEAPTAPANLSVKSKTDSMVSLSWTRATDNIVIQKYIVLRNGDEVGETSATDFTDMGLLADTAYEYTVKAYDGNGNASDESNIVTVTTDKGTVDGGIINLGYGKDGEEYLDELAKELGVEVENSNSITYEGKTFICDEINSRILNGRYLVDAHTFSEFFRPYEEIKKEITELDSGYFNTVAYADDDGGIATIAARGARSTTAADFSDRTSSTSDIIQVAVKGEQSENVRNIQQVLMKMNCWYYNGEKTNAAATGGYGEITKQSLIRFQTLIMGREGSAINNNNCDLDMARELSFYYKMCIKTEPPQDAAVRAAKDYLIKLGYRNEFRFPINGQFDTVYNQALWAFIKDYGYMYDYVTVCNKDKPTLYGWLQEKATWKTMYPDLEQVKSYIVSKQKFGELRDRIDIIGNNTLQINCKVLQYGHDLYIPVEVHLEMQTIGNNQYASPEAINFAITHYLNEKSQQGIYARQWASNPDGIIYHVKPADKFDAIAPETTQEDLMVFINKKGPEWERAYVSRTFNSWVDENQQALDLISFLPVAFVPAQGANIVIDYITDGQKAALQRAGCIVVGAIAGVAVAEVAGVLKTAVINCGDDVIRMQGVVRTVAEAISKVKTAADDFLNFVSGKVVKLRDGLGFRPAMAGVDNAEDALTILNNSEISNMSKIESIAGAAGRYLSIDEIAPEIANAVKKVKFRGTVLDMMDESGNVLKRVVVPEGYRSTQQLLYKAVTGEVDVTRWGYTNASKMEEVVSNVNTYLNRTDLGSTPTLRNSKYAGQIYNGVEFDPLGFPIFKGNQLKTELSILDDTVVNQKGLTNMSSIEHQQAATRQFKQMMQQQANSSGQTLENYLRGKGFNDTQIGDIISERNKITDYTWHHHQETGRMQLVDETVHESARHNGGDSLWGSGSIEE